MQAITKVNAQESDLAMLASLSLFAGYSGKGCFSPARLSEMLFATIWQIVFSVIRRQNVSVMTS